MTITTKVNTHFTNLMEDDMLANIYFSKQSLNEYNCERLNELKNDVFFSNKKYQIVASLLSIAMLSNIQSFISRVLLMVEKERKINLEYKNQLEIFELNLAYLILSGKIKSVVKFGFSSDYIKELLKAKKNELENSFVKYDYDEKVGRVSQILNDRAIVLSNIPSAVRERMK